MAQAHGDYIVNKIVKETLDFFQKVATGYIVIIIVKEPRVFIQKVATCCFGVFFVQVISMYLLFKFWSKWWIHFKKTQHISTGFWLDKLLKKSQLNHNVSTDYIPPCPQCVPLPKSSQTKHVRQSREVDKLWVINIIWGHQLPGPKSGMVEDQKYNYKGTCVHQIDESGGPHGAPCTQPSYWFWKRDLEKTFGVRVESLG